MCDGGGAGGEGFGAGVKAQPGDLVLGDAATKVSLRLVDHHPVTTHDQFASGHQSGDATADDHSQRSARCRRGGSGGGLGTTSPVQQAHRVGSGV